MTRTSGGKIAGWTIALALGWGLGGCTLVGPRNYENENDRLRKENLELKKSVDDLNAKLQGRIQQLNALDQATTRPAMDGYTLADLPVASAVRFARYTGPVDTNGDGSDDTIRLYVQPLDQKQRFIPIAGSAKAQVLVLQPGQPPQVLADASFTLADLDQAYRAGLMGTHYTLDVPLPADLAAPETQVTVKLAITDAATGASLSCEEPMTLHLRQGASGGTGVPPVTEPATTEP